MSTRPFDTYDYVEELIHGGFTKTQAEANMRALVKTLDFTIENKLATKDQLHNVVIRLDQFETKFVTKNEFNTAITGLEEELNTATTKLEKEIQQLDIKIHQVEHRLDSKIDQVEHRLDAKIQRLDHKIDKIFLKTVVINGISTSSIITIACTVMTFLIKF